MLRELDLNKTVSPCGPLHDRRLKSVSVKGNQMVFSFDIALDPEEYTDDYYLSYLECKQCVMTVTMSEDPINYYSLHSCLNRRGKFKGLSLNRKDFLDMINHLSEVSFIECTTANRELTVEFYIGGQKAKGKYRKYNRYDKCYVTLDAERVEWQWN